jgi:hypothetical protein
LCTYKEISLTAIQLLRIERKYDVQVHSYTNRLYASGRFQKTVAAHLPELSQSATVLSRTSFGTDFPGQKSEQLAMFYITPETYRRFTLAEVLIMAAMDMKTSRPVSGSCIRRNTAVGQRG